MTQTDRVERLIHDARGFVELRPAPDLTAAVMGQIAGLDVHAAKQSPRGWITRLARSLWSPQRVTFELRPAYGLIAAAGLAVLGVLIQHKPWTSEQCLTANAANADK